jgi:hypothetical protein
MVCVHELYLRGNVFANLFPRNAYMSQYHVSLGGVILQTPYFFYICQVIANHVYSVDLQRQPKQDFSVMRSVHRFPSSLTGEQR